MKHLVSVLFFVFCLQILRAQTYSSQATGYTPGKENIEARHQFQDNKYGMFIHWGLSSVLADGEWVMNNRNINVKDYTRLLRVFNPVDFDAAKWVAAAKMPV